jgi:hypothetical protein
MARDRDLATLRTEARYARERYDLYRAKAYGPRSTSAARLRELERICRFAEARLARAKVGIDAGGSPGSSRAPFE